MALNIDIPDLSPSLTESQIMDSLPEMSSQIETYILSFFIISIFWLSYHQVFNHIRESHISMVHLNLVFLLLITLLSISTSLVITFDTYRISYLVYYSVVVATSSLLVVIWWYAMRIEATDEKLHPLFKRGLLTQLVIVPVVFVMSIAVSFVSLDVAQYFWLAIIPLSIYYRRKFRHWWGSNTKLCAALNGLNLNSINRPIILVITNPAQNPLSIIQSQTVIWRLFFMFFVEIIFQYSISLESFFSIYKKEPSKALNCQIQAPIISII